MRFIYRLLGIVLLLGLVGGVVFLMTWDIPPPSSTVEKVIPDERLPR
jgi:hypothetical protein